MPAIDYTRYKAHATMYKGVRFRSRLEATWAAFFDELQWPWEYEPFVIGNWSPDFLIDGKGGKALVEVKPITEIDINVKEKMMQSADGFVLILCGVSPVRIPTIGGKKFSLGLWMYPYLDRDDWGQNCFRDIGGRIDLCLGYPFLGMVTGYDEEKNNQDIIIWEYWEEPIARLWAKAKNATQWLAPK